MIHKRRLSVGMAIFALVAGACGSATTVSGASSGAGQPVAAELPEVSENRFFANVDEIEFFSERENERTFLRSRAISKPGGPMFGGIETIRGFTRPGFPTVDYQRECGNGIVVQVITTVHDPNNPPPNDDGIPEFARPFGLNPGIVDTTNRLGTSEQNPREVFNVTDHLNAIGIDDPEVDSYQWISTRRPMPTVDTGAYVTTEFSPAEDLDVEVVVFSGIIQVGEDGSDLLEPELVVPVVFGDDLLAQLENPAFSDRFTCVADTWAAIEPTIAAYQDDRTQ